jgi:hypothetical protein
VRKILKSDDSSMLGAGLQIAAAMFADFM